MVSKISSLFEELILIILFLFHILYIIAEENFYKGKDFLSYYTKIAIDFVMTFLFLGKVTKSVEKFYPGVHTVHPDERLTKPEWLTKYKVSFMHGSRSTPLSIEEH